VVNVSAQVDDHTVVLKRVIIPPSAASRIGVLQLAATQFNPI